MTLAPAKRRVITLRADPSPAPDTGAASLRRHFRRTLWRYGAAVCAIAAVWIVLHLLLTGWHQTHVAEIRVASLVARQQMLSQRIASLALQIQLSSARDDRRQHALELGQLVAEWECFHEGLRYGNSSLDLKGDNSNVVLAMFAEMQPAYFGLLNSSQRLVAEVKSSAGNDVEVGRTVAAIQLFQRDFLESMDRLTFQIDRETRERRVSRQLTASLTSGLALLAFAFLAWCAVRAGQHDLRQAAHLVERLESELGAARRVAPLATKRKEFSGNSLLAH